MVDFVALLAAAGISLAEKVIFSWFEEGRTTVKVSQLEKQIAELTAKECERVKIEEHELRRVTEGIIKELIAESPRLSYVKPRFHKTVVNLDFDPKDPASSKDLMRELQGRLAGIAKKEVAMASPAEQPNIGRTAAVGYEIVPPATTAHPPRVRAAESRHDRSAELLREMRKRITDREGGRE
ncbi:hypothetical protein [Nocardia transvalensis]|uniref:hypothetical protein n=1 Tax=Nocardia transvalensis TaxID=37333 RepID=UPI0018943FC3|nr:hypothetical protein [Nocardia transvalensis]MBF6333952.1 hypothetical protein [Nocardia transvalensis]